MPYENKTIGQILDETMTRDDFIYSINSGLSAIGIGPDQDYDGIVLKSGVVELSSLLEMALNARPST